MQIIKGKIPGAKKVVIYGPEGIGKSTFASKFPGAVFIDTEGSTKDMDVARLPRPTSWNMLLEEIQYIKAHPSECGTLIIDTIDWAEALCITHICDTHHKSGIEDFGYGNGYVYVKEEFGRFLNRLEDVVEAGIHVVLTAHAQIRKFEQPDEMGAYDRWELKLGKKTQSQTSPLVKEWADMLLFANYKTYSISVDDKGKKHKAQGGKRVMYTQHHPCWDAKNRYGLPDECDFDYGVIAAVIQTGSQRKAGNGAPVSDAEKTFPERSKDDFMNTPKDADEQVDFNTGERVTDKKEEPPKEKPPEEYKQQELDLSRTEAFRLNDYIPKALQDLMYGDLVSEEEVMEAVYQRGYLPRGTPFENLPKDFVDGCLIGGWPQVLDVVKGIRSTYKTPFD